MAEFAKKSVKDMLHTVSVPVTEEGRIALKTLSARQRKSLGRLMAEAIEKEWGLRILPDELREAE